MTVSKLGIKVAVILFAGLLCAPWSFAVQREEATADTEKQASEDGKKSSVADDSAKKTTRTPFGRSKSASGKKPKPAAPATTPFMQVEEKGDSVTFKRRTPFGVQAWTKKRSELTPEEQKMLRNHQAKQADSQPTKSSPTSAETTPAAR